MSSGGGGGQFPQYGQQPNYASRMGGGSYNAYGGGNSAAWRPRGGFMAEPSMQPQGAALAQQANANVMGFPRMGQPQMSGEFQGGMSQGKNMPMQAPDSVPGFAVNQSASAPQQAPQQSFEQFSSTLGNSGMTSGQMQDAYQKSLQQASAPTNFWGNVGPGGTQNPFPQTPNWTPPQWGQQTFGFDPRSMAGKQVTGDLGWYYGRDAIGRTIGNDGSAMAQPRPAADGFNRFNPAWQRG